MGCSQSQERLPQLRSTMQPRNKSNSVTKRRPSLTIADLHRLEKERNNKLNKHTGARKGDDNESVISHQGHVDAWVRKEMMAVEGVGGRRNIARRSSGEKRAEASPPTSFGRSPDGLSSGSRKGRAASLSSSAAAALSPPSRRHHRRTQSIASSSATVNEEKEEEEETPIMVVLSPYDDDDDASTMTTSVTRSILKGSSANKKQNYNKKTAGPHPKSSSPSPPHASQSLLLLDTLAAPSPISLLNGAPSPSPPMAAASTSSQQQQHPFHLTAKALEPFDFTIHEQGSDDEDGPSLSPGRDHSLYNNAGNLTQHHLTMNNTTLDKTGGQLLLGGNGDATIDGSTAMLANDTTIIIASDSVVDVNNYTAANGSPSPDNSNNRHHLALSASGVPSQLVAALSNARLSASDAVAVLDKQILLLALAHHNDGRRGGEDGSSKSQSRSNPIEQGDREQQLIANIRAMAEEKERAEKQQAADDENEHRRKQQQQRRQVHHHQHDNDKHTIRRATVSQEAIKAKQGKAEGTTLSLAGRRRGADHPHRGRAPSPVVSQCSGGGMRGGDDDDDNSSSISSSDDSSLNFERIPTGYSTGRWQSKQTPSPASQQQRVMATKRRSSASATSASASASNGMTFGDADDSISTKSYGSAAITTRSVGGRSYVSANVDPNLKALRRKMMQSRGW